LKDPITMKLSWISINRDRILIEAMNLDGLYTQKKVILIKCREHCRNG